MGITVREIAQALGMSPSTVSQALNNKGSLKRETRERIIAKAKELGYHIATDPFGVDRIISGRPVWFILSGSNRAPLRSELAAFSGTALQGVEQAFAPYHTQLTIQAEEALYQPLPDDLVGIIVSGGSISEAAADALRNSQKAVVTVGCHLDQSDTICAVECDGVAGIRLAVEHLYRLGHRRIAFLNGPATLRTSDQKLTGYIRGCHDWGITVVQPEIVSSPWDVSVAEVTARALLLGAWHDVTGIVCAYEQMALGVLIAAHSLGLSVPSHLSIVAYHDEGVSQTADPPLTTIALPVLEMGKLAARLIVSAGKNRDIAGARVVLPPCLVVRESTGRPSPREEMRVRSVFGGGPRHDTH